MTLKKPCTADEYAEMTDNTRRLLRVQNSGRQEQRVKPDPETHPLAELDYEKQATHGRRKIGNEL